MHYHQPCSEHKRSPVTQASVLARGAVVLQALVHKCDDLIQHTRLKSFLAGDSPDQAIDSLDVCGTTKKRTSRGRGLAQAFCRYCVFVERHEIFRVRSEAGAQFRNPIVDLAGFANIATSEHPRDGLVLRDAFITSAARCAPPDNKPTPEELANCSSHLGDEIDALPNVRFIVGLGKIGFDAYLRFLHSRGIALRPKPVFAHGAFHKLPNGQVLIGCYHPSRQNTNTGKLTPRMMRAVFAQVARGLKAT